MAYDPRVPYDELPDLPPAQDLETIPVLKACLAATRALSELKGLGRSIPDQAILIHAIPLQEARMSSEIENIVTTQDSLFLAASDESAATDPATKEVLRYRQALRWGFEQLRAGQRISPESIRGIAGVLRGREVGFRTAAEGVVIYHRGENRVIYSPPKGGSEIEARLENLQQYLNQEDGPDPLIRLAVAHYQFEAIHPFDDGNGRTGRILNILYLVQAGLLDIPVLYLSRYINRNRGQYYGLLRGVTESAQWEEWVLFMLVGITEMAHWTTERIRAIRALFDETVEICRTAAPGAYSRELLEVIFRIPYCRIDSVVAAGLAKRQTASRYLVQLADAGILKPIKVGRQAIYINWRLLELLRD